MRTWQRTGIWRRLTGAGSGRAHSAEEKWNNFLETFLPLMDRRAPKRDIRIKNTDAPQVSEDTKALMSRRRAALKSGDKENYRRLNKIARAAIRRDEREDIRRGVQEAGRSSTWKTVKHVVVPKCGSSSVEQLNLFAHPRLCLRRTCFLVVCLGYVQLAFNCSL